MIGPTEYTRPAYCHACGDPYPWTATAKRKYVELLNELDALTPEDRKRLEADADDLIAETAGTAVAVVRFKKALQKVGREMAPEMLKVALQMASEAARQKIGGGGTTGG